MKWLVRAWKKYQARTDTGHGYALYTVGETTNGRPVLVDASDWHRAQRDPQYKHRLLLEAHRLDMERR